MLQYRFSTAKYFPSAGENRECPVSPEAGSIQSFSVGASGGSGATLGFHASSLMGQAPHSPPPEVVSLGSAGEADQNCIKGKKVLMVVERPEESVKGSSLALFP